MLTYDEARARLSHDIRPLSIERIGLRAAAGRVLAVDLLAHAPIPRFDNSAMDGYALAVGNLRGEGPWWLHVRSESAAGRPSPALKPDTACRIFTGAPIPVGADTVIMQERVRRDGDAIAFDTAPRAGDHIRRAGEDLAAGARALARGTRLGPGPIALAGMLGCSEVAVRRRPIITILCTGDELRAPGEALGDSGIPESNSAPISALAAQAGAIVRVAPIVADDLARTDAAVADALRGADLLLTVGGVSVGDHDVVRPALERAGIVLDFWKVAIKPGKPLAVGRSSHAHVLGLPGNPASALVTFALFGMPLLRAMQGDASPHPLPLIAPLAVRVKASPERTQFVRATLAVEDGALVVHPHDNQSSGAATSLAACDSLAVIPPGESAFERGARVQVLRWIDF